MVWPELFSLCLLCVSLAKTNEWGEAFVWQIAVSDEQYGMTHRGEWEWIEGQPEARAQVVRPQVKCIVIKELKIPPQDEEGIFCLHIHKLWMRSSRVVRASDYPCQSRNPSILQHSGIWGTADGAVWKKVHKTHKKIPLLKRFAFTVPTKNGRNRGISVTLPPTHILARLCREGFLFLPCNN